MRLRLVWLEIPPTSKEGSIWASFQPVQMRGGGRVKRCGLVESKPSLYLASGI